MPQPDADSRRPRILKQQPLEEADSRKRPVTGCAVSLAFLLKFSQSVPHDMSTLDVVYQVRCISTEAQSRLLGRLLVIGLVKRVTE